MFAGHSRQFHVIPIPTGILEKEEGARVVIFRGARATFRRLPGAPGGQIFLRGTSNFMTYRPMTSKGQINTYRINQNVSTFKKLHSLEGESFYILLSITYCDLLTILITSVFLMVLLVPANKCMSSCHTVPALQYILWQIAGGVFFRLSWLMKKN